MRVQTRELAIAIAQAEQRQTLVDERAAQEQLLRTQLDESSAELQASSATVSHHKTASHNRMISAHTAQFKASCLKCTVCPSCDHMCLVKAAHLPNGCYPVRMLALLAWRLYQTFSE